MNINTSHTLGCTTNKLEIPRDKDEVNKWEIHECDGREYDPDTMVAPLTPKTTHTTEALTRVPSTIASCHEEDVPLRKWPMSRYCYTSWILETKTKVGNTGVKAPVPRINQNIDETPTVPKSHTELSGRWGGEQEFFFLLHFSDTCVGGINVWGSVHLPGMSHHPLVTVMCPSVYRE